MKILVTGFTPFGGEKINPAYQAVKKLPQEIDGATIIKREIPTEFKQSKEVMEELISTLKPDAIWCVGQAGGRATLTLEKVAINLADGRIPDNVGYQPVDETIEGRGETAYFSTLPIKAMAREMNKAGVPTGISYSAGTYVCNYLMYCSLYLVSKYSPKTRCGFIHVPFAPSQGVGKALNVPTMEISTMTQGLLAGLRIIASGVDESHEVGGEIA